MLTELNINWVNWAFSAHKTSKIYSNNIPILYSKWKIILDASISLFSDFATPNLPLSSRTQNDKHKNSTSESGVFVSSLDEIEIMKTVKASNQAKAWCPPVQRDSGSLVSFYRNTDNLEPGSAFSFYIVIKGIRNNNKNPILPYFHSGV